MFSELSLNYVTFKVIRSIYLHLLPNLVIKIEKQMYIYNRKLNTHLISRDTE